MCVRTIVHLTITFPWFAHLHLSLNNYKEDAFCLERHSTYFSERDLIHCVEGQGPELTESPFRTQVGVGRGIL